MTAKKKKPAKKPPRARPPVNAEPIPPRFRNRIKEHRRVKAADLIPNPKNARLHPQSQRDATMGILTELGKCAELRAIETPAGLLLLDGHLRADLDREEEWDVAILDLTPEEAELFLATFDAAGAMAEIDPVRLAALIAEIDTESAAVQAMLDQMAAADPVPEDDGAKGESPLQECPSCGHRFRLGEK